MSVQERLKGIELIIEVLKSHSDGSIVLNSEQLISVKRKVLHLIDNL